MGADVDSARPPAKRRSLVDGRLILRTTILVLTGSLALVTARGATAQCLDTCPSAHDGECDDGGPGSLYDVCALGTDCSDCGPRVCGHSCPFDGDGECDDGGPGSDTNVCDFGSDCSDCGPRSRHYLAPIRHHAPESGPICEDTCFSANDGECDDGGPGSLYDICEYGTDCSDCGPRERP